LYQLRTTSSLLFGFAFPPAAPADSFHDLLQVVGGNLRAVGVAPVENQLQRAVEGIEIAGKSAGKRTSSSAFCSSMVGLDLLRAFQQQDVGKGFGAGKALGQLHRVFAVVFVVDGDGGVGHLQRRGKGNSST
jgi:hypothetical protein